MLSIQIGVVCIVFTALQGLYLVGINSLALCFPKYYFTLLIQIFRLFYAFSSSIFTASINLPALLSARFKKMYSFVQVRQLVLYHRKQSRGLLFYFYNERLFGGLQEQLYPPNHSFVLFSKKEDLRVISSYPQRSNNRRALCL